jgi:2-isopropylmalate synthase
MEVPARQPYAGELVFTAFSGSHQDAIKKSWAAQKPETPWDVLYIPIDPGDIGRSYKAIIRINSQSGKGGVAYVLEHEFGFQLPKLMHKEIGKIINDLADEKKTELTPTEVHDAFVREYIDRKGPIAVGEIQHIERGHEVTCQASIAVYDKELQVIGKGNGPIDAFVHALHEAGVPPFELLHYAEHSLDTGAEARAISYIQIKTSRGHTWFGAGIDTNIELASIKALVSALNRALPPIEVPTPERLAPIAK